jgi:hypothetical protein
MGMQRHRTRLSNGRVWSNLPTLVPYTLHPLPGNTNIFRPMHQLRDSRPFLRYSLEKEYRRVVQWNPWTHSSPGARESTRNGLQRKHGNGGSRAAECYSYYNK